MASQHWQRLMWIAHSEKIYLERAQPLQRYAFRPLTQEEIKDNAKTSHVHLIFFVLFCFCFAAHWIGSTSLCLGVDIFLLIIWKYCTLWSCPSSLSKRWTVYWFWGWPRTTKFTLHPITKCYALNGKWLLYGVRPRNVTYSANQRNMHAMLLSLPIPRWFLLQRFCNFSLQWRFCSFARKKRRKRKKPMLMYSWNWWKARTELLLTVKHDLNITLHFLRILLFINN